MNPNVTEQQTKEESGPSASTQAVPPAPKKTATVSVPKWALGTLIGLGALIVLAVAAILVVLLCFDRNMMKPPVSTSTAPTTYITTTASSPETTMPDASTTPPVTVVTSIAVVEVPAVSGFQSYTTHLDGSTVIFSGPGFGYAYVGTVGQSTQYTIVSEQTVDGVVWGKLKSGLGWVALSTPYYAPPQQPSEYSLDVNYTTRLDASDPIYSGPGYGCTYVGTVGQSTKYTIVEEYHSGGSCWGRLKSGLGWVPLY